MSLCVCRWACGCVNVCWREGGIQCSYVLYTVRTQIVQQGAENTRLYFEVLGFYFTILRACQVSFRITWILCFTHIWEILIGQCVLAWSLKLHLTRSDWLLRLENMHSICPNNQTFVRKSNFLLFLFFYSVFFIRFSKRAGWHCVWSERK